MLDVLGNRTVSGADATGEIFLNGALCTPSMAKHSSGYVLQVRNLQSCTQIIRPLVRFYSYDYDLRKPNYIFK